MALELGGTACVTGKEIGRWYYRMRIEPGAFDDWLADDDWLGHGRVIMAADHWEEVGTMVAATDAEDAPLSFSIKDRSDGQQELNYEFSMPEDGYDAQIQLYKQVDQGVVTMVSIGLVFERIAWEDLDEPEPLLLIERGSLRELSAVAFGAMGDDGDGSIKVLKGDHK